jgi:hypothetical protein
LAPAIVSDTGSTKGTADFRFMLIDRFPKLFCRFVASVANNEIDESFGSGSCVGYGQHEDIYYFLWRRSSIPIFINSNPDPAGVFFEPT